MSSLNTRPAARMRQLVLSTCIGTAGLLASTWSMPAHASTYVISIDTHAITGVTGSVDLQWNVGAVDPSMIASVFSFAGGVLDGAPILLSGNVTGSFAPGGILNFAGSLPGDYIYQPLTFGSTISFDLTLPDTAAVPSGGFFGSVFAVSLLGVDALPLLPADPIDGTSLQFNFAPGDAPVLSTFGPVSVSVISPVPEPETYALTFAGLLMIAFLRRRRQRTPP